MLTDAVPPFPKVPTLDLHKEEGNLAKTMEARARAMMIGINTMARQAHKMLKELAKEDDTQEQKAQEMEELRFTT